MTFLSLETSTRHLGLAVFRDGKILAKKTIVLKTVLSDTMIPAIKRLLYSAKVPFNRLDGFAVGLGPGSFTSLRVGLSTVKALSFATGKPVAGVSSLDAMALSARTYTKARRAESAGDHLICVIADAKRNLLYACLYEEAGGVFKKKSPYLLCSASDLLKKIKKPAFFIGNGIKIAKDEIRAAALAGGWDASFADEKLWYPTAAGLPPKGLRLKSSTMPRRLFLCTFIPTIAR